ncbi:MAG: hypothetical protein ACNY01_03500 [Desulfobacteria bacterium]
MPKAGMIRKILFCGDMTNCRAVALVLILALSQSVHAEDSITGSAQILWRSTSTEADREKDKSIDLHQVYNINLNKDITSKVSFAADMGVNSTKTGTEDTSGDTDTTRTTRLFPQFRLNVANEYFDANWGYQLDERGLDLDLLGMSSDEDRLTNETWTGSISTNLNEYPKLRIRYDKSRDFDDLSPHKEDTRSEVHEETFDYTYRFVDVTARHLEDETANLVDDSTQTATNDEARLQFTKSLWANRIATSGSYRWSDVKQKSVTGSQDVEFNIKRDARRGLYAKDTAPIDGELAVEQQLIDGNTVVRTPSAINIGARGNEDEHNIGAELYDSESVAKIYVYTDTVYADNDRNPVPWAVYSADDNTPATTWTQIGAAGVITRYVEDKRRFEISFPSISRKYFKVANTAKAIKQDLYVTEIELIGVKIQPSDTTDRNEITRENIVFNAGVRPTDWLNITYYFTEDENKTDSDSDSDKTRESSHNISVRGDLDLSATMAAWAQIQRRFEKDSAETEDRTTDTYSLHLDYIPIDTLITGLSFNHSEPKKGSETESRTSASLLHIVAIPYKGVELTIDGNLNYTDNLVSDTETFTRTFDSDLRLELTRTLTAEFRYTANQATTNVKDGPDISGRDFNFESEIYYRPIRSLYFRSSYELQRGGGGEWTGINQYNINWIMTQKLRLNLDYRQKRTSEGKQHYSSDLTWNHLSPFQRYSGAVTTTFSPDLTWNLSKIFVLRFQYNRNREKADVVTKTETFTATLSARF